MISSIKPLSSAQYQTLVDWWMIKGPLFEDPLLKSQFPNLYLSTSQYLTMLCWITLTSLLSLHCSVSSLAPTILISNTVGSQLSLFNSTVSTNAIAYHLKSPAFFSVSPESSLTVERSSFAFLSAFHNSPIVSNGEVILSQLSLDTQNSPVILSSLVDSSNFTNNPLYVSIVELDNSRINNLNLYDLPGSFVSSGDVFVQSIQRCRFCNISSNKQTAQSLACHCVVCDSHVSYGTIGIYGDIVTGYTPLTLNRFECRNTTFLHCQHSARSSRILRSTDVSNACTSTNTQYSYQAVPSHHDTYVYTHLTVDVTCTGTIGRAVFTDTDSYRKEKVGHYWKGLKRKAKYHYFYTYYDLNSANFTSCQFTSCSAAANGGAISWSSSALTSTLSVMSCSFQSCSATAGSGGGCYLMKASLSVNDSIFDNCLASLLGGGVYLSDVSGTVTSCYFIRCSAPNGGGVYWIPPDSQYSRDVWFSNSMFFEDQCSAVAHDVYIQSNMNDFNQTVFDESCFTFTHPSQRVFHASHIFDEWLRWTKGFYVSTVAGSDSSCLSDNDATSCTSIYDALQRTTCAYLPSFRVLLQRGTHVSEENEITICDKDVTIVPANEEDMPTLVFEEKFPSDTCSMFTVLSTLSLLDFAVVISCSCENPVFAVSETGTLNLTRMDIAASSASVTLSTSFINLGTTSTLNLNNVNIFNFTVTNAPLIGMSSATVPNMFFGNVTVSSVHRSSGNGTVFDLSDVAESLSISSFKFKECVCENGFGGAIYASPVSDVCVELSELTFTDCRAQTGGCLAFNLLSGGSIGYLGGWVFSGCDDVAGCLVYVISRDGVALAQMSPWDELTSDVKDLTSEFNYYWISEEEVEGRHGFNSSLFHFRYGPSVDESISRVYVREEGADISNCGWSDISCYSIEYGKKIGGSKINTIIIRGRVGDIMRNSDWSNINIECEEIGEYGEIGINYSLFEGSCNSVISNNLTLSITGIFFVLDDLLSPLSLPSTFIESSSNLTLTRMVFSHHASQQPGITQTPIPLPFSLLSLTSGTLTASGIVVKHLFFTAPPIRISQECSDLNISSLDASFISLHNSSFFTMVSASAYLPRKLSLTFDQCFFGGISSTSTFPAVLSPLLFSSTDPTSYNSFPFSLRISNCEFISCISGYSTQGGVIYFPLPSYGSLSVVDTNVSKSGCSCLTSTIRSRNSDSGVGMGGFIYIEAYTPQYSGMQFADNPLSINFLRVACSSNTAAVGTDIYVSCNSLSRQLSKDMFGLTSMTEPVTNSLSGISHDDDSRDVDLVSFFHLSFANNESTGTGLSGYLKAIIALIILLLIILPPLALFLFVIISHSDKVTFPSCSLFNFRKGSVTPEIISHPSRDYEGAHAEECTASPSCVSSEESVGHEELSHTPAHKGTPEGHTHTVIMSDY